MSTHLWPLPITRLGKAANNNSPKTWLIRSQAVFVDHFSQVISTFLIWVWININTIFRGMNIHLHPFTGYFDVHQGYKVLTHCHIQIPGISAYSATENGPIGRWNPRRALVIRVATYPAMKQQKPLWLGIGNGKQHMFIRLIRYRFVITSSWPSSVQPLLLVSSSLNVLHAPVLYWSNTEEFGSCKHHIHRLYLRFFLLFTHPLVTHFTSPDGIGISMLWQFIDWAPQHTH